MFIYSSNPRINSVMRSILSERMRGKPRRFEGKSEAPAPAAEAKPERKGKTAKA